MQHTVEQGEYLTLIAAEAGFRSSLTIWNDPQNEALRHERSNPQVLYPGDVVFVPDASDRVEMCATGRTHIFVAKREVLKLRFGLRDFDNRTVVGAAIVVQVGGIEQTLVTDSDGMVATEIDRRSRGGWLRVPLWGMEMDLALGYLDPVSEDSGWLARLINLGYYRGALDDAGEGASKLWSWALEEFQCDFSLPITGQPDSATQAQLLKLHGS